MRSSSIILAAALVSSAAPSFAAPVPQPLVESTSDLEARAGASAVIKPLLKSAGSSAALTALLAGFSKLFGGSDDDQSAPARRAGVGSVVAEAEEGAASAFLKPLIKNIASSAALTAFFGEIGKLTGSSDSSSQRRALSDDLISLVESSPNFTQEQLDEVEAEFAKIIPNGLVSRDLEERAATGAITKEVLGFLAEVIGSITGKAATNVALGNNVDGSAPSKRDLELDERAGAAGLLKPLLKSAASSAAVSAFFDGISKLFGGGDDQAASKRDEVIARAGAAGLLKPLLKSAASSAAVSAFFDGISKLFGGGDDQAASKRALSVDDMISKIENSDLFTQDQLDEVEAELSKAMAGDFLRRDLEARALKLGGVTKSVVGLIGSLLGSVGIDALFGSDDQQASRRAAPISAEDVITKIENSDLFTQDQLDEVEAELSKAMAGGLLARSDLEARALKLGGLTKGLVGIIGSVLGSVGVDALFGKDDTATRSFEGLDALD